jgi:hypothetical protein
MATKAFEETSWQDEQGTTWTREDFFAKLDWEGGLLELLVYGGPGIFPPSLRALMSQVNDLVEAIDAEEDGNVEEDEA